MPPQSQRERLREIKDHIADAGSVSVADFNAFSAILDNVIARCDAADLAAAGVTADDGSGTAEAGTDAVHRADAQHEAAEIADDNSGDTDADGEADADGETTAKAKKTKTGKKK